MECTLSVMDRLENINASLSVDKDNESGLLRQLYLDLLKIREDIESHNAEYSIKVKEDIHNKLKLTIEKIKDLFAHIHPDNEIELSLDQEYLLRKIQNEIIHLNLFILPALSDLPEELNHLKAICGAPLHTIRERLNQIPNADDKSMRVARKNMRLNRYSDILPYDENRVLLTNNRFINASYIEGGKFIASSGPTAKTLKSWWRMIIEHDIRLIVMTTNEYEWKITLHKLSKEKVPKCQNYWKNPALINKSLVKIKGWKCKKISLPEKLKGKSGQGIIKQVISLQGPEREKRKISWIQYRNWPDSGIADPKLFLVFYRVIIEEMAKTPKSPPLIHCSAGCGRTGVTLALISLLLQLTQSSDPLYEILDIDDCIERLRQERVSMVQTPEQYKMIARVLLEYLQGELNESNV